MSKKTEKAIVKATGKFVDVYSSSLKPDIWIDYSDCTTTYHKSQLSFNNPK